ncbi:Carcinoembryonic antigen-related cell adhesion molecule 1 [Dissostichus eleginoides]|uniref:Carcinoembryonic antigen-related cell adhesion molecule 1 n=1 Tax=Dissostichus eleginoides TaxID=100907 RepID=A0AAD9C5L3_DISEL|nr:Carcinoembryonic antigen-related cell adhesion molecule 1 [Dissostichus eleginoides]
MDIFALLWIVSLAFTGLTEGAGVLPDGPLNAAVGGKVMFTTTQTPGTTFVTVNWKFEYEGRITFFMSTGSLELRNLTLNDIGEYSVTMFLPEAPAQSGDTRLDVYEPVTNVTVTSSSTELVEFSSVSLSCSSSGSSLSFLWLNSSSEVTGSDRVQITDGNSTLTIVNVTRYDQGPFSCQVFNPVSNGTSDPLNLTIYYGPENVILKISPPHKHYQEGSDISLMCSAVSNPLAHYTWFLNGGLLSKGSQFNLINSQKNQSGSYSCQAFNDKTLRYETSHPATISVLALVTNVVVTSEPTELVEFSFSVSLSCSSSGSSLSFLWLNSSSEVTGSDRVQITDGNSTLTINNVTRYDQGPFSCQVFNPVSIGTSDPLNLTIYFPQGCSVGCIAGIVIGVLVVLGVVAAIVWYCFHDKKKPNKKLSAENTNARTGVEGQDNGAYTTSQELHNADVCFTKNNNGGTVQMGDQNKPSDYAEVRVNNNPRAAASSLPTYDAHLQRNKRTAPQPETAEL